MALARRDSLGPCIIHIRETWRPEIPPKGGFLVRGLISYYLGSRMASGRKTQRQGVGCYGWQHGPDHRVPGQDSPAASYG